MGIVRNAVKCGGCKATIVLRVGVGLDKEQPFYFVCANCNAASRGKMMLYDQGSVRIELEGSELIPEVVGQYQVVTLHPDLPSITSVDTLDGFGSSPFLMQRQLLGERFSEFYERLGRFRGVVDQDWVAFRRWFGYYLDNRSAQFDLEGERLLGETWKIPRGDFDRHDIVHFALELLTSPLWVHPFFPEMKADLALVFGVVIKTAAPVLRQFANDSLEEVVNLQRDLFHCLELYVDNRSSILPGLAVEMYVDGEEAAQRDLRVLRDDFPRLRDLYIATFEAVHHSLDFVVALENIKVRNDPNAFPSGRPKNLKAFSKQVNAEKAKSLLTLAAWHRHWPDILDRSVRNAIGHHSVRHDLASGTLISRDNEPIPYLSFVAKTFRLVHPMLAASTALKYLRIAAI